MDRKSILGLVIIGGLLIGWWIWSMPSKEELEQKRIVKEQREDSIRLAKIEAQTLDSLNKVKILQAADSIKQVKDTSFTALPDSIKTIKQDSLEKASLTAVYGAFTGHGKGEKGFITIETDKYVLRIARQGGYIAEVKLKGFQSFNSYISQKPDTLDLMIPGSASYGMNLSVSGGKFFKTDSLYFDVIGGDTKITGNDSTAVLLRAYANGDSASYLEYAYTIRGNDYMLDYDIHFKNLENIIDANQRAFDFRWVMRTPNQERDLSGERDRSSIYYKKASGGVDNFGSSGKGKKEKMKQLKWVSFKQQFFSTTLIADAEFPLEENQAEYVSPKEDSTIAVDYSATLSVAYNYKADEVFGMKMYLGPNHYNTLKSYNLDLEDQINLGFFWLISWINKGVILVFNTFENMNLGYGVIILLLTLIIKIITTPVTYKTFVSSAKMRVLKPEIDEINAKFPNTEDALKKQQTIMQLYKRAGVSPLSGCIPSLLQMPILFAMFSFFPAAVELRQQSFLWAVDLSTYDSILTLPFKIPFYGSHVSLFTLLMTATTLIYTSMTSGQMNTGAANAKQMKIIMFLMPILFLGVLNSYSAALSYYYFLSTLISILLTLLIRKFFINEDKLRAKIEEHKKKPVKKSKFMQRLEDMQKVREEQMRKGKKR